MTELDRLFRQGWTLGELVAFHSVNKLLMLAHSPEEYGKLGRLVGQAADLDRSDVEELYRRCFAAALAEGTTPGKDLNALQHAAAYFKKGPDEARREVLDSIDKFSRGKVSLQEAKSVILRHAEELTLTYLASQRYLQNSYVPEENRLT